MASSASRSFLKLPIVTRLSLAGRAPLRAQSTKSFWHKLTTISPQASTATTSKAEDEPLAAAKLEACRLPGLTAEDFEGQPKLSRAPPRPPITPREVQQSAEDELKSDSAHNKLSYTDYNSAQRLIQIQLAHRRPRRALHAFRQLALTAPPSVAPSALFALCALFSSYNQPSLYLAALSHLHKLGYAVPAPVAASLLRSCAFELAEPAKLAKVVGWLGEALRSGVETQEERVEVEELAERVMDQLKRMGRSAEVEQVFVAYRASFDAPPTTSATAPQHERDAASGTGPGVGVWSTFIASRGLDGDLDGARSAFDEWRAQHFAATATSTTSERAPPPDRPYLTLLNAYTNHPPPPTLPSSLDPAYHFLPLLTQDALALSSNTFTQLLRLELSRRQYGSFWGLWEHMDKGGWRKTREAWLTAVRALNWHQLVVPRRAWNMRNGRAPPEMKRDRPLLRMAGYETRPTPSTRALFGQLLVQEQQETLGRPRLVVKEARERAMDTALLNEFLRLFVSKAYFLAAALVLETFAVHAIEPDNRTHSLVVLGVVEAWKNGKAGKALEEADGLEAFPPRRRGEVGEERLRQWETPPEAPTDLERLREEQGMKLVQRILRARQTKAGLWADHASAEKRQPLAFAEESEAEGEAGEVAQMLRGQRPAPEWMRRRELRDTRYLHSLLRRSSIEPVPSEERWKEQLARLRETLIPPKRGARQVAGAGTGEEEGRLPAKAGRMAKREARRVKVETFKDVVRKQREAENGRVVRVAQVGTRGQRFRSETLARRE